MRIQKRIERLVQWVDVKVPKSDCTISVDLADFHAKCAEIQSIIERLVRTQLTGRNLVSIEKQLGRLWVEVENITMFHSDLVGPVDRLWTALSRKNERIRRMRQAVS